MSRRTPSTFAGVALAVLLTATLAACASQAGGTPTTTPTSSPDETTSGVELEAAWLDDGRMIGIVTTGSSTCVPTAEEATLDGSVLEVDLVTPDGACTRDLVPRVSVVAVPEGVDPAEDLEINATVDGVEGNVTLAGVSGLAGPGTETDFVPSAGWTGVTGTFVLVTWGSSTCPRIVESAEATGPAEVTVTFVVPPADQVCTMDMVPHGDVLVVDGLEGASDVALVLEAGPDAEPVSLKIYGEN